MKVLTVAIASLILGASFFGCGSTPAEPSADPSGLRSAALAPDGTVGQGDLSKAATMLTITYDSPFITTELLELNGMMRPTGSWTTDLCTKATDQDSLTCTLRVPAGATSIVLSAHAQGDGGADAWSCGEDPCGSKVYTDVGLLTVKKGAKKLAATKIRNGFSCGCNHEFMLN